jgi:anti-sigma factor ChrR (cupin superfamily)
MSSLKPEASSDIHELVSLYALNALDSLEQAAFKEHLRKGCANCEADLRSFTRIADAIGTSVTASPTPQPRERLRSQLTRSSRTPGVLFEQSGLLISRSAELAWRAMTPGITYKPLYEDSVRKHHTSLVRMDAGAHYPSHRHAEIEELFVLSGDLHVEGQIMRSGDYCRAESGTIHEETFTDSGCLFLLSASQENEVLA